MALGQRNCVHERKPRRRDSNGWHWANEHAREVEAVEGGGWYDAAHEGRGGAVCTETKGAQTNETLRQPLYRQ